MGQKRIGKGTGRQLSAAVETGAPQSRLGAGSYTVWAAVSMTNGLTVASEPVTFTVTEKAAARQP